MLRGLVNDDHPVTLQYVLQRMRTEHRDSTLSYPQDDWVMRYEDVAVRIDRLASALSELGVGQSDRVGILMWNRPEYWETYYAVPCMGAVHHALNQRLHPNQLLYTIRHAGDKVIIVEDVLLPLLEEIADGLDMVSHFVIVGRAGSSSLSPVSRYEELLGDQPDGFLYPRIEDDRLASALAYTSGTTSDPKAALYSHRANVIHAMSLCMVDTFGIRASDRVLQTSPLFHAMGWSLPWACGLSGASVVLPGKNVDAGRICRLIESEAITMTGAVPTVLADMLRYADEHKPDLSSLRFVLAGAMAAPLSIMKGLKDRHGVEVIGSCGMTEMGPVGGTGWPPPDVDAEEAWHYKQKSGRTYPLTEYRIVDAEGNDLPRDGEATGEMLVRGPWVITEYYGQPEQDTNRFVDGWLRTGDVASIDPYGYIEITDRLKDVIKSGGEWISSLKLEAELVGHAAVNEVAVVAVPDERWDERPLACVVTAEGARVDAKELRQFLVGKVAKLWLPDYFAFLDELPKTSTGKYDKKALRDMHASGEMKLEEVVAEEAQR